MKIKVWAKTRGTSQWFATLKIQIMLWNPWEAVSSVGRLQASSGLPQEGSAVASDLPRQAAAGDPQSGSAQGSTRLGVTVTIKQPPNGIIPGPPGSQDRMLITAQTAYQLSYLTVKNQTPNKTELCLLYKSILSGMVFPTSIMKEDRKSAVVHIHVRSVLQWL